MASTGACSSITSTAAVLAHVNGRVRFNLLTHVHGRRDGLDNGRAGNKALGLTLVDRLGVAR
jgi:hypothetical protein